MRPQRCGLTKPSQNIQVLDLDNNETPIAQKSARKIKRLDERVRM